MRVDGWSVRLRSGGLVGGLAACALALTPAAPAWAGFSAFSPSSANGQGENDWFLSPGTITYTLQSDIRFSDRSLADFAGVVFARVYVTEQNELGTCSVNGEAVERNVTGYADRLEWEISLPPVSGPSEGTYDVECTYDRVRAETTVYIGFIDGETETTREQVREEVRVKIDSTGPSVSAATQDPASLDPQGTRWHNSPTTIAFTGTDQGSGIASCSQPVAIDGPAGAADRTATGSCRNNAGQVTEVSYVYRYDDAAPVSAAQLPPSRNGWYRGDTQVTWNWSDSLSGIKPGACPGTSTSDGQGTAVIVSATCSDWAGNEQSASRTLKVDTTAPGITLADRPRPNAAGWHNEDVVIKWSCSDALSGPEAETTSETADVEGEAVSVTGTCIDLAGNSAQDTQSGIKLDKTPPAARPSVTGREGLNGWHLSPVSVLWGWSDSLSGVVEDQCVQGVGTEEEGAAQELDAECADVAGNVGSASRTFNVDLFDPEISASVDREPGSTGWYTAPVTISYACQDPGTGSGLASSACPQDVTVTEEGTTTVTRSVTDRAGRRSVVETTVKLDLNDPTIAAAPDRSPDVDGWYTSPVAVAFTCSDPPPGSGIADCPTPVTVATEGDRTVAGQARDQAGRLSANAAAEVRLDLEPPDSTITRRGTAAQIGLDGAQLRDLVGGSATDTVSGVREVMIKWTHPVRGPESATAELQCTDATRRACTWLAKVPLGQAWNATVVATDRVGRVDPTPAPSR